MKDKDSSYERSNTAGAFFVGFWIGVALMLIGRMCINIPTHAEKEPAVKEFIQHPENFKVYHIKDDTIIVDIKVEYLR